MDPFTLALLVMWLGYPAATILALWLLGLL